MFELNDDKIERHAVMTLSNGAKVPCSITIPRPTKPIFHEQLERRFVEQYNKKQPHAKHKVVKVHIMRN